jgi:RNA polymerase II subunit A small phosphatase-like protein
VIDAIDASGRLIVHRLYRAAAVETRCYPAVKDLSRVGRDLARTVLVDDTPAAFLRQPANGLPVLAFRGDADDRLLAEAVLPMLRVGGC